TLRSVQDGESRRLVGPLHREVSACAATRDLFSLGEGRTRGQCEVRVLREFFVLCAMSSLRCAGWTLCGRSVRDRGDDLAQSGFGLRRLAAPAGRRRLRRRGERRPFPRTAASLNFWLTLL